jgi:hypothetical protein
MIIFPLILEDSDILILRAFTIIVSTSFIGNRHCSAADNAIYSASIVNSAICGCSLLFHKIGTSPSVKMNPVHD